MDSRLSASLRVCFRPPRSRSHIVLPQWLHQHPVSLTHHTASTKAMEEAGAVCLTLHMRRPYDREGEPAKWDTLKPIVDALSIPVLANGDMYTAADLATIRRKSGCAGVLVARPALWNASIFRLAPYWRALVDGTAAGADAEGGEVVEAAGGAAGGEAGGGGATGGAGATAPAKLLKPATVMRRYVAMCERWAPEYAANAKYTIVEMMNNRVS